jgi:hypothetical protein
MKLLAVALVTFGVLAPLSAGALVWVNGYYRSDGAYVQGHYRTDPNTFLYDNYSYTPTYTGYTCADMSKKSDRRQLARYEKLLKKADKICDKGTAAECADATLAASSERIYDCGLDDSWKAEECAEKKKVWLESKDKCVTPLTACRAEYGKKVGSAYYEGETLMCECKRGYSFEKDPTECTKI